MLVNIDGHVTNLLHKARIEVNEQGTVAAAATGAVVIPLMGSMKPRFRADHPFMFFIRHIPTGTILFEGRVNKPEEAPPQAQRQPPQTRPQHVQQRPQHVQQRPQLSASEESKFQAPQQINHNQQPILTTQQIYEVSPSRSPQPQQAPANTQFIPQQNFQNVFQTQQKNQQQQQQQQHIPLGNRQSEYEDRQSEFLRQPSASNVHNQEYRPQNNPQQQYKNDKQDVNFLLSIAPKENNSRIFYADENGQFVQPGTLPQH